MLASLQAAATMLQPAKLHGLQLRSAPQVSKGFGVETSSAGARLTCSLHTDTKEFAAQSADAGKMTGLALVTSALLAWGAGAEDVPKRLTFDEIQSKTYMEVRGTGTVNHCLKIEGGSFTFKAGKYNMKKFCLEPRSFTIKAEFQKTKLMTHLTYTLDDIEGPFDVLPDGTVKLEEKNRLDYVAVTVQLPGGERVPFLFTIKQLASSGMPDNTQGNSLVPSFTGSSFLDLKGRGGSTGYDNVVALPAGGRGDEEELAKENNKDNSSSTGKISLTMTKSKTETSEVIRFFESLLPSDTDMG